MINSTESSTIRSRSQCNAYGGLGTKPPLRETLDGNRERYQLLQNGKAHWISRAEFTRLVESLPELSDDLAPYDLRYFEANIGLRMDPAGVFPSPVATMITPNDKVWVMMSVLKRLAPDHEVPSWLDTSLRRVLQSPQVIGFTAIGSKDDLDPTVLAEWAKTRQSDKTVNSSSTPLLALKECKQRADLVIIVGEVLDAEEPSLDHSN